jgi:hypothetical protein
LGFQGFRERVLRAAEVIEAAGILEHLVLEATTRTMGSIVTMKICDLKLMSQQLSKHMMFIRGLSWCDMIHNLHSPLEVTGIARSHRNKDGSPIDSSAKMWLR